MNNISINGESIILKPHTKYIALDSLYLTKIGKDAANLDEVILSDEIRNRIFPFPYTDIPFAEFISTESIFKISNIIKADYDKIEFTEKNKYFSSDTGMLVIIKFDFIKILSMNFNYEELVDTKFDGINLNYWNKITSQFEFEDIGLVMAPGFESGYEFEGGGVYKIEY